MLLVKKKSDDPSKTKYRLALDLRLLNSIIEPTSYPLPKINNIIAHLAKFKFFTCLDMPSAYHQIDMPEEFQDKLSFTTPWSTYKYKRLCFGLKNAASYFQAMIDLIIEECGIEGVYSYQDDLIIGSNSIDETCQKLQILFNVCKAHNLTFFAPKCSFHQIEVNYLGFNISQNKVYPISSNIKKITSFAVPKNKKQLKRFIGVCGFYRHIIPLYARLMEPLVKLSSPKATFKWEDIHQQAFEQLQKIFFNQPFLCQPNFDKPFYLNTDASKYAISAILMQKQEDQILPISYYSKALKKSETRYPAIKLELMAIVRGIEAFKFYLYGRHFTILSDSRPLKHYRKTSSPTDITTNWLLKLSDYDFTFEHIPGRENLLADLLSRHEVNVQDLNSNPDLLITEEVIPIFSEEVNNLNRNHSPQSPIHSPALFSPAHSSESHLPSHMPTSSSHPSHSHMSYNSPSSNPEAYNNDLSSIYISQLLQSLEDIPNDPPCEISHDTICREQLKDKNCVALYKKIIDQVPHIKYKGYFITDNLLMFTKDDDPRIVMPSSLQSKAIKIAHVSHFGIQKTFQSVSKSYYWRGCFADVANFVRSCERCNSAKPHRIPQAPFQANPIPTQPGDYISMDIVGPFFNGMYVVTIIDHFSRFLTLHPLRSITSENVVKVVFEYITTHGRPSQILTDLGRQFTAQIFQNFAESFGIRLIHTSVAHPQANSISERVNTSIKSTISALIQEGYDFKNALRIHQMLYNSSIHSSTKFTPNHIHFGREISMLYDTYISSPELSVDINQNFFQIMQDLQKIYEQVYSNLLVAQRLQNSNQYKKAVLREIKCGDMVYLKGNNTFKTRYTGPFKIIKKTSPVNFKIQRPNQPGAPITNVHIDRLWLAPARRQHLESHNDSLSVQVHHPPLCVNLDDNSTALPPNSNSDTNCIPDHATPHINCDTVTNSVADHMNSPMDPNPVPCNSNCNNTCPNVNNNNNSIADQRYNLRPRRTRHAYRS